MVTIDSTREVYRWEKDLVTQALKHKLVADKELLISDVTSVPVTPDSAGPHNCKLGKIEYINELLDSLLTEELAQLVEERYVGFKHKDEATDTLYRIIMDDRVISVIDEE